VSKAYRDKDCTYCCRANSSTGADHVLARQFFLEQHRGNLPKVPACKQCNGEKSELELYLTSTIPFGATHAHATNALELLIPKRLERNQKLHHELIEGRELVIGIEPGRAQPSVGVSALPFRGDTLVALMEYIARGLTFWHWKLLLPPDRTVLSAAFVHSEVAPFFEQLMAQNALNRVSDTLGNGVFTYEGVQAAAPLELTVWRMSFGTVFKSDQHDQHPRVAYAVTGPSSMRAAVEFADMLKSPSVTP
jgi:hypothetical protein